MSYMYKNTIMITAWCLLLVTAASAIFHPQEEADSITGVWLNTQKDAKVEIFRRADGLYYGRIIWLKFPVEKDGSQKLDTRNPDESLRNTPLIGLVVLDGFRYEGGEWVGGVKYDPKSGRSFKCTIILENGVLDIQGTSGWTHRHDRWTRLPAEQ